MIFDIGGNMKITKDICETSGCARPAQVNYLGSPLCLKCKNQIQVYKFDNGRYTMAVAGFKSKYPAEYATGRIQ